MVCYRIHNGEQDWIPEDTENSSTTVLFPSDVESFKTSRFSNVSLEKDIEPDEQQFQQSQYEKRAELFHSTIGLRLQGLCIIFTKTFEKMQASLNQLYVYRKVKSYSFR